MDEVVWPVLRAWKIFERNDFTGDGLKARDELAAFLTKVGQEAALFNDKREVHFEKQIARGIEPVRITK